MNFDFFCFDVFPKPIKMHFFSDDTPSGPADSKIKKADPTKAFDFIPAKKDDLADIVNLCTKGLIHDEPHSRALHLSAEGSKPLFEYLVSKALHYPYSYRVHEKALHLSAEGSKPLFEYLVSKALHYPYSYRVHEKGTNNLIGFRLLSIGHRDHNLDVEPIPFKESEEPGCRRLSDVFGEILEESKANFWRIVDPSVQKVIRREITYVIPRHQRKGIANYLLHLGLNFDELKEQGIHGITSEASSLANQQLLAKHGYVCLSRPNYKLEMFDGNKGVMVFFKDLRT
ncbi:hypothetical protein OESDEN_02468 [Oesophagostomum dentatum]|uniref:N-acetyltransferase domain-containing protein n=1 Tax=Oesophagostomum dentatum TaxID=61180 RepID=A0A0B1TQ89_OESDE|nr:hypothetical protein OESDEN_02468 [Oesophagostomum dentatum]